VILCRHRAAKVSTAAVRVSAGASEHAAVARVANMARALEELRSEGLTIVGLDSSAEQALDEIDLCQPLVLVLGSEGSGLRRLVKRSCDSVASIPLEGSIASLDVAVACALALYEVTGQRRKKA
jgi:23S rRNA (guanosine2251-2'-O)-methyltransferase